MIKLAFMGDTFLKTKDGTDPFAYVKPILSNADIRFLNLETALTRYQESAKKHIRIKTNLENVKYLQDAKIDVVNLNNNHTLDCGAFGYFDMHTELICADVRPLTKNWYVVADHNDITICFLGFHLFEKDDLYGLLRQVTLSSCDILIVSLHWGQEHMPIPSPWQIETAHKLIDAGAKIIVGHHSHCMQGIERYKEGLIAYSLGNFNFWQNDVEMKWYNRIAPILTVNIKNNSIMAYSTYHCKIDDNYMPLPNPYFFDAFWNLEDTLSEQIGTYTEKEWYNLLGYQYVTQTIKSSVLAIKAYGFYPLWRLIKWLCRTHTHKAILGMLRTGKIDRWKQYGENLAMDLK